MITALCVVIPSTAALAARPAPVPTVGYDVSYPQCGAALPANPAFGIVGVSDGRALGENPCLGVEYAWASKAPSPGLYMNTGNPGTASTKVDWYHQTGPQGCSETTPAGCAYDYGFNGAAQAYGYAATTVGDSAAALATWWLDVETANSWSTDTSANLLDIQGSIDFLKSKVTTIGIYSTGYQWNQLTGGAQLPDRPNWVAGAINVKRAQAMCSSSFTGGRVLLVQYPSGGLDADYAC
jgi:hypothetical protein